MRLTTKYFIFIKIVLKQFFGKLKETTSVGSELTSLKWKAALPTTGQQSKKYLERTDVS